MLSYIPSDSVTILSMPTVSVVTSSEIIPQAASQGPDLLTHVSQQIHTRTLAKWESSVYHKTQLLKYLRFTSKCSITSTGCPEVCVTWATLMQDAGGECTVQAARQHSVRKDHAPEEVSRALPFPFPPTHCWCCPGNVPTKGI